MDEIINLAPMRGSNYSKVQEFYKKLSKNFDALLTLEEGEKLHGFVLAMLNKFPRVKPDLVRVDESWEDWSMEDLIDALQRLLTRNSTRSLRSTCSKKTKAKTGQRKGASFSKEGFLLKTTQKPYFFPYGKWLIFPVPHQTDPDSDVTPLPQRDRKKYPPNVKAAPRFTKHDDSQPSKQEHS